MHSSISVIIIIVTVFELAGISCGIAIRQHSLNKRGGKLNAKYVDSSSLLLVNVSTIGWETKHLFNASYAPYNVLCPSESLVRSADKV